MLAEEVHSLIEQNKQLQKENGRLTEENDILRKRIASMDENAITRLREKKDAEIKELQERFGKAESEAVRSGNKAYSEHQRAENAEKKLREMLDIPEIKEIWESIQRNKEDFSKQIDKWIEDGVATIRNYADGKDNDFQPKQGNSVAWGIIAEAFRYGLYPTDEKQHRMAAAYLLESYIDTPSSSLSGSLWWKEVLPCYTKHLNATNIRKSHNMCSRLFICPFICPFKFIDTQRIIRKLGICLFVCLFIYLPFYLPFQLTL